MSAETSPADDNLESRIREAERRLEEAATLAAEAERRAEEEIKALEADLERERGEKEQALAAAAQWLQEQLDGLRQEAEGR
jgi:ABC-type phosphate transport system auxiliary subunit